jgi:hypothetical protein
MMTVFLNSPKTKFTHKMMPTYHDPGEKPTPAEIQRMRQELASLQGRVAKRQKGKPLRSHLPPSYAAIFDECVEYAANKTIGRDPERCLISKKTPYMFVQRAVIEYMNAIVLDARQNGVYIGLKEETPDNTHP